MAVSFLLSSWPFGLFGIAIDAVSVKAPEDDLYKQAYNPDRPDGHCGAHRRHRLQIMKLVVRNHRENRQTNRCNHKEADDLTAVTGRSTLWSLA